MSCYSTYDLGCFDSCDIITLDEATVGVDIPYTQTGIHKIKYETQFRFTNSQAGEEDDIIELDLSEFPENYDLELKIYNPDGTLYILNKDEIEYNCFKIRISIYTTV